MRRGATLPIDLGRSSQDLPPRRTNVRVRWPPWRRQCLLDACLESFPARTCGGARSCLGGPLQSVGDPPCSFQSLFVEPNIFKPPIVIDAVLVLHVALHVRMPTGVGDAMGDDGVGDILGQFSFDCPDQLLSLGYIYHP